LLKVTILLLLIVTLTLNAFVVWVVLILLHNIQTKESWLWKLIMRLRTWINVSFFFVYTKTTFFCRDKDRTLTYQRLTSFMASFTDLEFLYIKLSLDPCLFPIPLVLRYMVTFGSGFYQTLFLAFLIVIYFIGGYLTMMIRTKSSSNSPIKCMLTSFVTSVISFKPYIRSSWNFTGRY